jgi:hypothetical protein
MTETSAVPEKKIGLVLPIRTEVPCEQLLQRVEQLTEYEHMGCPLLGAQTL